MSKDLDNASEKAVSNKAVETASTNLAKGFASLTQMPFFEDDAKEVIAEILEIVFVTEANNPVIKIVEIVDGSLINKEEARIIKNQTFAVLKTISFDHKQFATCSYDLEKIIDAANWDDLFTIHERHRNACIGLAKVTVKEFFRKDGRLYQYKLGKKVYENTQTISKHNDTFRFLLGRSYEHEQRIIELESSQTPQNSQQAALQKLLQKQSEFCQYGYGGKLRAYVPVFTRIRLEEGKDARFQSFILLIAENTVTVATGNPGSGKTTLAHHLAYVLGESYLDPGFNNDFFHTEKKLLTEIEESEHATEKDFTIADGCLRAIDEFSHEHEGLVPLYFRASTLTSFVVENSSITWFSLIEKYFQNVHDGFLNSCSTDIAAAVVEPGLKKLIIIDGLDEIKTAFVRTNGLGEKKSTGTDYRRMLLEWLHRQELDRGIMGLKNSRFLILSRPNGYEGFEVKEQGSKLVPFLIEKLAYSQQRFLAESLSGNKFAKEVDRSASENHTLLDFLSTPLVLTIAANVYKNAGVLPENRATLYEKCVQLNLKDWPAKKLDDLDGNVSKALSDDFEKYVELLRNPKIEKEFRQNLGAIAVDAHTLSISKTESTVIPRENVFEKAAYFIDAIDSEDKLPSNHSFPDYLALHTGLLLELSEQNFAFAHRSFQEYLAAHFLLISWGSASTQGEHELTNYLLENPDQWRMVWQMAVEICVVNAKHQGELFGELSTKIPKLEDLIESVRTTASHIRELDRQKGWALTVEIGVALDALINAGTLASQEEADGLLKTERTLGSNTTCLINDFVNLIQATTDTPATEVYGKPKDRAACARVLGWLGDPRPGVSVKNHNGVQTPDFDWVEINVDKEWQTCKMVQIDTSIFRVMKLVPTKGEGLLLPAHYRVSKHLVTVDQFGLFEQALNRTGDETDLYFKGLSATDSQIDIKASLWPVPNHPRDNINWYQAMAFCRWLNRVACDNDDWVYRLGTEWEWHYAMSGENRGSAYYPWGDDYQEGFANIVAGNDFIGRTTAVGIYPQQAKKGVPADCIGNLWEWCLNEHETPENTAESGRAIRALRGGSWYNDAEDAALSSRYSGFPGDRDDHLGFRVFCVPAIH